MVVFVVLLEGGLLEETRLVFTGLLEEGLEFKLGLMSLEGGLESTLPLASERGGEEEEDADEERVASNASDCGRGRSMSLAEDSERGSM